MKESEKRVSRNTRGRPNMVTVEDLVVRAGAQEQLALDRVRNKIVHGDCVEVMKRLPGGIADMVFADPPYFLQLPPKRLIRWSGTRVEGVKEDWDIFESFEDYDNFTSAWLSSVRRIMKPKATLWVIGTYHNIYRLGKIMQDLGFWILNDVIWIKTNPMPNFLGVRFTNATETLIWALRDKGVKGYTFNKDYGKTFGDGKIGANVWRIPLCLGQERLKDERGKKLHPTQKPVGLLKRVILTSTNKGDLVFDPFGGTGTTGYAAAGLERDFVMVEKVERYVLAAASRLASFRTTEDIRQL